MSKSFLLNALSLALLSSSAVYAAPVASRTPEQIVCDLTGDCNGKTEIDPAQRLDRPEEAPFSFTRPDAVKAAAPAKMAVQAPVAAPRAYAGQRAPLKRDRTVAAGSYDMRINFELGSADLSEQAKAEAQAFATALKAPATSGKRYRVEGHTDSLGDREPNLKLSQERADSVAAYLQSLGVEATRLEAKGFGFDRPLPGRSARAATNRRVQFVPVG